MINKVFEIIKIVIIKTKIRTYNDKEIDEFPQIALLNSKIKFDAN